MNHHFLLITKKVQKGKEIEKRKTERDRKKRQLQMLKSTRFYPKFKAPVITFPLVVIMVPHVDTRIFLGSLVHNHQATD